MVELSERHKIANKFSDFIKTEGLNRPYGGTTMLVETNGRKYYRVGFSIGNHVSGQINVYSPKFIQVDYTYDGETDNPVFESTRNAKSFLKRRIIKNDKKKSEEIKRKPPVDP